MRGISYRGKPLEIRLHLPAASKAPVYHVVSNVRLNGRAVSGLTRDAQLAAKGNRIDVHFGAILAATRASTWPRRWSAPTAMTRASSLLRHPRC